MFFNDLGLVTDDQGDQLLYIPWKHIHGLWKWIMKENKPYQTYPGYKFRRELVGFILSNYEETIFQSH